MPDPLFTDGALLARIRKLEAERDKLKATLGWLRAEVAKLRDQAELNVSVAEGTVLHGATKVRLRPLNEVVALFDAYPGRTDETERAFEGGLMTDRRDPRSPAFHLGTTPNPNGPGIVELDPTCCHHGHPLNPGTCTRGWQPCGGPHHGHRTWECWHALDDQLDGPLCRDTVLWPPRGEQCTPISGYGTGGSP